jgi:hypothetical protein
MKMASANKCWISQNFTKRIDSLSANARQKNGFLIIRDNVHNNGGTERYIEFVKGNCILSYFDALCGTSCQYTNDEALKQVIIDKGAVKEVLQFNTVQDMRNAVSSAGEILQKVNTLKNQFTSLNTELGGIQNRARQSVNELKGLQERRQMVGQQLSSLSQQGVIPFQQFDGADGYPASSMSSSSSSFSSPRRNRPNRMSAGLFREADTFFDGL